MKIQSNLIAYRQIYTYLNEETLKQAMEDGNGDLLVNMLKEQLNRISVATILITLGNSLKSEYISLLWYYTNHSDPLTRESAYMALSCYPDEEKPQYNYFLTKFKNNLIAEKSPGVRKSLEHCIEWFEEVENIR